jgi:hypothetical protein
MIPLINPYFVIQCWGKLYSLELLNIQQHHLEEHQFVKPGNFLPTLP